MVQLEHSRRVEEIEMIRFVVVLVCLSAVSACATLDESLTDIQSGDCVADPGAVDEVLELKAVDCSDPGVLRVTNTLQVTAYSEFPGEDTLNSIAEADCAANATVWLVPTKESWEIADDRLVACFEE